MYTNREASRGSVVLGVGILCLAATAWGRSQHPKFRSTPTTVKTSENDTVLLPCYIEHQGANVVRWWWNKQLVSDSSNHSVEPPPRFRVWPNNTLQVSELRPEDTGEYTCQVVRPQPWGPIQQMHAIEVLHPPSVQPSPDTGELEVVLGDDVEMGCEASGVPQPIITWAHKGEELLLLDNRPKLRFLAENRTQAGLYTCTASNGVSEPASADIRLRILYPPEVRTEHTWVHASPGIRAQLSCSIVADPEARVEWLKEGQPLPTDHRVTAIPSTNRHTLLFRKVIKSDFGYYTCVAKNEIGKNQQIIHLSGVANPAVFKTDSRVSQDNNFTLIWEVDSFSPIIEYRLLFRKYNGSLQDGHWATLVIPADVGSYAPGQVHSKSYTFTGLASATVYEVTLLSRNTFGWSKPSPILRFATEGADLEEKQISEQSIPQHETNLMPAEVAAILNDINHASCSYCSGSMMLIGLAVLLWYCQ